MIGGISTGAFVLADAGLLADRRCTVHWEYADWFQSRYPSIALSRDLYVVDRNVFTCSGGTAALDMMLHFVSQAAGPAIATAVAEQFIHPQIRRQDDHQRLACTPAMASTVRSWPGIIKLMESAVENPLDIRELAELVGISARQVERLFREQLGMSPKVFYLKLRLARARTLLRQTVDPVLAVAVECGFTSTSHFSHAYKRIFGIPPTQERQSADGTQPGPATPQEDAAALRQRARITRCPVAHRTARHRTMPLERGIGMTMAVEAKPVKPGLDALSKVGARASVAGDAGFHASPVGVVVMTGQAIDRSMLVVREVEREGARAPHERLPQRRVDLGGHQRGDPDGARDGGDHDQGRMPAEDQLATHPVRHRRGPRRGRGCRRRDVAGPGGGCGGPVAA